MVLQFCILWIIMFFAPLVPPILSPLGFSFTGALLLQGANPRILSAITVWISTLSVIIIWIIQNHIIERLTLYETIESNNRLLRRINNINKQFRNQEKITHLSKRREEYIKTRTGRFATFLFAIFCFLPILPDIIGTRILYRKIKFPYLILAVLIGKSLSHIPFIFIGKGLLQLLHIIP